MKTKLIILLLLFIPLSLVHAEDEIVAYKLTSQNGLPDNMLLKNNPNSYGVRAGNYLETVANAKKRSGAEGHNLNDIIKATSTHNGICN